MNGHLSNVEFTQALQGFAVVNAQGDECGFKDSPVL
jgi:hypothetical protein